MTLKRALAEPGRFGRSNARPPCVQHNLRREAVWNARPIADKARGCRALPSRIIRLA